VYEVIADDHRRARERLEGLPGVTDVQMFGERAHVRVTGGPSRRDGVEPEADVAADTGDGVAAWLREALEADRLRVESVRQVAASLEDVFIARLTGEASKNVGS
jgi:hypothetical protein